ncbi:hypothetical protein N7491_004651 [Penicillium cf. griseofulvum]|uniref:Uncharacterized protein n=1 Tax=Penicillium cf. griseofulvum TaxID=2972120 RepID=A0A9W9J1Z2_9EURO|nr:hypothetical protein N7472_007341 [Penicillium cf. griseofulvum]KAJ5434056.1 hypothetical protein N7491_004651 [Penicillium cf. griseofulvum]KAJ5451888.1 hypothetical protein N7445_000071 [Penicillium cf. griseofulvum]
MTSVEVYYEQPEDSNWLDAFSGDNGSIDQRTLEIHQVEVHPVVITHHSTHHPYQASRCEQQPSFQLFRCSSLDLRTLGFMKLEHEPPVPTILSEPSLRRLYSVIGKHTPRQTFANFHYKEGDSSSLATSATDSEYENCLLPFCAALAQPSEKYSGAVATSSPLPSSSADYEPQWLPIVVVQVVSSKARKACPAFKRRFFR